MRMGPLMRVMTFNVRGAFHDDGANDWARRRQLNIATIKKHAPDILCLQEAQSGNIATYEVELNDYAVELGPISIRKTEYYHHVPIYWKRERFEKVMQGGFYLSETPDEWSTGCGAELVRAVTWVRLRRLADGLVFTCLNTHFNHEQENHHSRIESARLIVQRLADVTTPIIITADFNALPRGDAYRVFIDAGYTDTYSGVAVNTFHGFKGDDFEWEGVRIDWILIKGFTVQSCQVITDAAPPVYPSDHYPVIADV